LKSQLPERHRKEDEGGLYVSSSKNTRPDLKSHKAKSGLRVWLKG
jgi:hypothetical protein